MVGGTWVELGRVGRVGLAIGLVSVRIEVGESQRESKDMVMLVEGGCRYCEMRALVPFIQFHSVQCHVMHQVVRSKQSPSPASLPVAN